MECCNEVLKVCKPLPDCMELLYIHVPPGYASETIVVQITNGKGMMVNLILDVENDKALIDLTDLTLIDAAWFNPFAGQYLLQYFDDEETLILPEYNGKAYDTIAFSVGQYSDPVGELNPFV